MKLNTTCISWLSKKIYLACIGFYATIGFIMLLPALFTKELGIPTFAASFMAFFIVTFLRATYESLIIYQAPIKSLSLHKMLLLVLITSSITSVISYAIKPSIGYFSIPVAIIISLAVVNKLKALLWPAHERPGFFSILPEKLKVVASGRYYFFGILVGITYLTYTQGNLNFALAFSTAFFSGMIVEEWYNTTKVYNLPMNKKRSISLIMWSAICAVLSTIIVILMMKQGGFSGQAATITSVIAIKLIQPLGARFYILRA